MITNDGRQDRMLMASDLLKKRIAEIKGPLGKGEVTLNDIEQTHILFTNAHFKPFAAIGFEYNKVTATSAGTLGGSVQFSIPQFGDFFHDMVLHTVIQQPKLTTSSFPPAKMKWCDFPGERLMKRIKFNVNGNPLDEYDSVVYNMYREYQVPPNKKVGWYKCIGQELPNHGFLDEYMSDTRVSADMHNGFQTPSGQKSEPMELFVPLLFWFNKDPRLSIPSVAIPFGQRFIDIELSSQEDLVNMVPGNGVSLDNNDKLSQSSVTFELYVNNIFMNPEIHDIFIQRVGFSLIRVHRMQSSTVNATQDGSLLLSNLKWPIETMFIGFRLNSVAKHMDSWYKFSNVKKVQTQVAGALGEVPVATVAGTFALGANSTIVSNTLTLTKASDTQVAPLSVKVDDYFVVYSQYAPVTSLAPGSVLDNPANYVYSSTNQLTEYARFKVASAAFTAAVAASGSNPSVAEYYTYTCASGTVSSVSFSLTTAVPMGNKVVVLVRRAPVTGTFSVATPLVSSMGIKAHGISIYQDLPSTFYNAYLPFHYGTPLNTPEDPGTMMVVFNLYPGSYQPSGHINVSRAREFYLTYKTSPKGFDSTSEGQGSVFIVASAINFLLISDGSAVLRYST